MNQDGPLATAAARLARAAPRDWEEFLKEYRLYAEDKRNQLVSSPIEELQKAQGRAQACAALQTLLEKCLKTADQIGAPK